MASRQKVTTTRVKARVKKDGTANSANYKICKNCNGKGVVRSYTKRKP